MINGEKKIERPIRLGFVGGGRTGQVGYKVAFDVDFERCVSFGVNLGFDKERLYPDYKTMIAEEAKREDGIEAIDLATPNFLHFSMVRDALNAGLNVICEKPLLMQMRKMVENGDLGEVNMVELEYAHGFGCDAIADVKAEGQIMAR